MITQEEYKQITGALLTLNTVAGGNPDLAIDQIGDVLGAANGALYACLSLRIPSLTRRQFLKDTLPASMSELMATLERICNESNKRENQDTM